MAWIDDADSRRWPSRAGGRWSSRAGPGASWLGETSCCGQLGGRPLDPAERRRALQSVRLEIHRTMDQDLGFGLRQLADIALRALSPGINDPTTAEEAILRC